MGSRHGAIATACRHLGLAAAMSWSLAPAFAQISSPCAPESVGTAKVSAVVDGRSFALDDGREVRLPGIEVPPPPRPGEAGLRADAWLASAGSPRSAAHEMLGQGFARVAAQVGNVACATELLA